MSWKDKPCCAAGGGAQQFGLSKAVEKRKEQRKRAVPFGYRKAGKTAQKRERPSSVASRDSFPRGESL